MLKNEFLAVAIQGSRKLHLSAKMVVQCDVPEDLVEPGFTARLKRLAS